MNGEFGYKTGKYDYTGLEGIITNVVGTCFIVTFDKEINTIKTHGFLRDEFEVVSSHTDKVIGILDI